MYQAKIADKELRGTRVPGWPVNNGIGSTKKF